VGEFVQPLTDPSLTGLSKILDPAALALHLRGVCVGRWNGGTNEQVRCVRVLRHHVRHRCTLEIGLRAENGGQSLIGKVYATDRFDIFEAMERIRKAGFGPEYEYSIPQPLAYLSSLGCLVQEKVEGPVAKEILRTGDEQSRAAVAERCARWLARFHALGPKAGPVSYSHDHLKSKSMRRCSRKVAKSGGLAVKAARLLQRLEDAVSSLSPAEMCAGHGSYTAGHVILAQGRTVVIDWDWHGMADPARDVGRFLYALRRWALQQLGSIRALDGVAEVFLKTYLAAGQPEVERNLRFFEAAACLKAGTRVKDEAPRQLAEAMLDEGLRVLAREATP